jgi:hypothetical protein
MTGVYFFDRCLLPAGMNFSGTFLLDGNDRKIHRLRMLLVLIEDYDVSIYDVCQYKKVPVPQIVESAQSPVNSWQASRQAGWFL